MFDSVPEPRVDEPVAPSPDFQHAPVRSHEPSLKALLARLGIEPIPDDVVVAHKREQIAAAGGSDIRFALAWFTNKAINLTMLAILVFSGVALPVGLVGSFFDGTWAILTLMGVVGVIAFRLLYLIAEAFDGIFVKPRARWGEVEYKSCYPYRIPEQVRARVALLRGNASLLPDGFVVTILELHQAEVCLDPIAMVASGHERYAIAIWD